MACRSNLSGVVEMNNGAQIRFDTMGILMIPDKSQANQWISTAGVQFESDDERDIWLNNILGIWEGTFNMKTYRHHYRIYLRISE